MVNDIIKFIENNIEISESRLKTLVSGFKEGLDKDPYDAFYCSHDIQSEICFCKANKKVLSSLTGQESPEDIIQIITSNLTKMVNDHGAKIQTVGTSGNTMIDNELFAWQQIMNQVTHRMNAWSKMGVTRASKVA